MEQKQERGEVQDAFVLGGGSSLRDFDFNLLSGRLVIGVNDAFRLGVQIVPITIFGDATWWNRVKWDLEKYAKTGGVVYSVAPALMNIKLDWLRCKNRVPNGLGDGENLGWNNSTGAAAINLAVNLGARVIYLLGFDMTTAPDGRTTHWHNYHRAPTRPDSFQRFLRGMDALSVDLKRRHPGVKILNVTDGSSKLPYFDRVHPNLAFRKPEPELLPQPAPPLSELIKRRVRRKVKHGTD